MKKQKQKSMSTQPQQQRHTGVARPPHRVAARLEGVVKNRGTKATRKKPNEPTL